MHSKNSISIMLALLLLILSAEVLAGPEQEELDSPSLFWEEATVSSAATAVWRVGFAALGRMVAPYICSAIQMELCGSIMVMTTEIIAPLVSVAGTAWVASRHECKWDVRHFISGYAGGVIAHLAYLSFFSNIVNQLPPQSFARTQLFYHLSSSVAEALGATIGFNLWPVAVESQGSSFNETRGTLELSIQLVSF